MTPLTLSLAMAITVVASALQAATGMGMALVAAPLLAVLDPEPAPVPALFAVMLLSALVTWRTRGDILRGPLPMALLGLFAGCAGGAALRDVLAGPRFNHVFALLILAAVGLSLLRVSVPTNRVSLLLGGLASGVLGTLSGAHGPPIALVMQHVPVRQMRATLCAFFTIGCRRRDAVSRRVRRSVAGLAADPLAGRPARPLGGAGDVGEQCRGELGTPRRVCVVFAPPLGSGPPAERTQPRDRHVRPSPGRAPRPSPGRAPGPSPGRAPGPP